MTLVKIRTLSLATAAALALGSPALAQQDPQAALLDKLQVKQRVARGHANDHVRLSAHFLALQSDYAADAKRHTSMAQPRAFAKAAELQQAQHCQLIAQRKTAQATILEDLAAHHTRLANGIASVPPVGGAPFEEGLGAPDSRPQNVTAASASAFTTSDHVVLSEYFTALAERYARGADEHAANARAWGRLTAKVPSAAQTVARCERVADELRALAVDAGATAGEHRSLAAEIT